MSVKVMKDSGMKKVPSKTQWNKVRKMQDHEIDYSDNPLLKEDFFEEAVVWKGIKKQITLRIDPDVIDFFKKQGKGYQTVINEVLRKYVEAQKKHAV
ncbi:MAG: BrnA antitoxin family protein [Leptospirales bacterium]